MKTRIIALIMLICVCLTSCTKKDLIVTTTNSSKPQTSSLDISVEIKKRWVRTDRDFEIRIGFGKKFNLYSKATLEINAPNMTIISPDGTTVDGKYTFEYLDFNDDKYEVYFADDEKNIPYYETFRFVYNGSDDCVGYITFWIIGELYEKQVCETDYIEAAGASISYKAYKKILRLTTKHLDANR